MNSTTTYTKPTAEQLAALTTPRQIVDAFQIELQRLQPLRAQAKEERRLRDRHPTPEISTCKTLTPAEKLLEDAEYVFIEKMWPFSEDFLKRSAPVLATPEAEVHTLSSMELRALIQLGGEIQELVLSMGGNPVPDLPKLEDLLARNMMARGVAYGTITGEDFPIPRGPMRTVLLDGPMIYLDRPSPPGPVRALPGNGQGPR